MAYGVSSANWQEQELAQQIVERSADLVAASLAGMIHFLNSVRHRETLCISAEGGLFWGHPNYVRMTQTALDALLKAQGLSHIRVEFIPPIEHTNLLGSAVAALS